MPELNDNHRRSLLATCQYIDYSLATAIRRASANSQPSPFEVYRADVDPEAIVRFSELLSGLRQAMLDLLRAEGIAVPNPEIGGLHVLQSVITACQDVVYELQPQFMKRFGELSPIASNSLEKISNQIAAQLHLMMRFTEQLQKRGVP
ncbi:MAG: hypothetical protein ACP5O7_05485 [Phycisphaerae bacterium]